jgi:hypothetical protein
MLMLVIVGLNLRLWLGVLMNLRVISIRMLKRTMVAVPMKKIVWVIVVVMLL